MRALFWTALVTNVLAVAINTLIIAVHAIEFGSWALVFLPIVLLHARLAWGFWRDHQITKARIGQEY